MNETFGGTSVNVGYDHAGNLIDDGNFVYVYDAWNRLVKVRSSADADKTIQTAKYDGTGRRIQKVVTNSGDLDGTFVYNYERGWKIAQVSDGSNVMEQQFIHGTQYIDEVVMMRAKDKGDLHLHQDANWNVLADTDLGGSIVERYVYTPYGELTVHQQTSYGDRDGDGDVDATDKGTVGVNCIGTVSGACRIVDLNCDGDYDAADASLFDTLKLGNKRRSGGIISKIYQELAAHGLPYDLELLQFHIRFRHLDPFKRRWIQRDPIFTFERNQLFNDGVSLYSLWRYNPFTWIDPFGLVCTPVGDTLNIVVVHFKVCCTYWGRLGDRYTRLCKICNGTSFVTYATTSACEGTPAPCPPPPAPPLPPNFQCSSECMLGCLIDFCDGIPNNEMQTQCGINCAVWCSSCGPNRIQ